MIACLPVYKARTNKFYIFQQCTYIVYLLHFVIKQQNIGSDSWTTPRQNILNFNLIFHIDQYIIHIGILVFILPFVRGNISA
jgi:hypothetical protein